MRAWIHGLLGVLMVGILANPLCVCSTEPTPAPAQEKSCCKQSTENPSQPIAPCDCETALTDGLLLAKQDFGNPQLFAPYLPAHQGVEHELGSANLASPLRRYDFRRPPLRHLLSVYRL